jgi:hypothetical protein
VDEFFGFRLGAAVTFELVQDGLADLVGDGEQDALAGVPESGGIGGDGLRRTGGLANMTHDSTPH